MGIKRLEYLFLLFLCACALLYTVRSLGFSKNRSQDVVIVEEAKPTPIGFVGYTIKCQQCTEAEKLRMAEVEKLQTRVIADKCMDEAWASFKRIEQSNGLDGAGIVKHIRSSGIKDIPIIFYWPSFWQSKKVIGYTYSGSPEIYLNRTFRTSNKWSVWAELSNAFHELLHKLGFGHDSKATARRPFSVPYLGNRAIEYCEKKLSL